MLLNFDKKERAEKQRKSKMYKNMLDQQIRDNQNYRQKKSRINTQPNYNHIRQSEYNKSNINNSLKLRQQSIFLPVISKFQNNQILSPKESSFFVKRRKPRQSNKNHYRHYSYTKKIEDSDQQLQKYLYDCQQLLQEFGNHSNARKKKFEHINHNNSYNHFQNNVLHDFNQKDKNFRSNQESIQKKERRDQIIHISIPAEPTNYKKLHSSEDYSSKQMKTSRKNKNLPYKYSKNFQTIKYLSQHDTLLNQQDEQKQDKIKNLHKNINEKQYQNQFQESLQQFKVQKGQKNKIKLKQNLYEKQKISSNSKNKLQQKMKQFEQIENEKKIYVLKHLRKAKNRGNLLFKKIQQFRNEQKRQK